MKKLLLIALLFVGCKHDPGSGTGTGLVTPALAFPPAGYSICKNLPDPCGGGWNGPTCTYICPSTCTVVVHNFGDGNGLVTICPN